LKDQQAIHCGQQTAQHSELRHNGNQQVAQEYDAPQGRNPALQIDNANVQQILADG
jgi:hypothetical protein